MKGYKRLCGVFFIFGALPCAGLAVAFHNVPENLSINKGRLIQYHDSGRYYGDISSVTQRALYYIKFRINQNKRLKRPKKLAVVFDIDETALTNYDDMRHLNFGGTENSKEIP